jgi:hypothetical protein
MKTAVQELMELNDFLKIMGVTIEWEKYLEKEKEQIINAYNQADLEGYFQKTYPKYAEEYYNKTYNQDKELPKDVKDMLDNL